LRDGSKLPALRLRRPAPRDFDRVWGSAVRGRYEPYATDNQARSAALVVGLSYQYDRRDGKERDYETDLGWKG
jgi:hypothetical protein